MNPAMTAPPADFAPFLIEQARLRASLLRASFGLGSDEWEDLRQELAMDCLRRLVNFDPARSDWRQFVHSVVRNHSCVLASRLSARPSMYPIDVDVDADQAETVADRDSDYEENRDGISSSCRSTCGMCLPVLPPTRGQSPAFFPGFRCALFGG
jgi:hypothetical protein